MLSHEEGNPGKWLNSSQNTIQKECQENNELVDDPTGLEDQQISVSHLSRDENGQKDTLIGSKNIPKSNPLLTAALIVKMVIGSWILTMPYTMRRMGYIFGILVLIVGVSLNQFETVMLLKAKNLSRHSNYTTIFHAIWPSRMSKGVASMVIFLSCSGVCIADLILFKTTVRKLIFDFMELDPESDPFYANQYFIVALISILEVPFMMAFKIQKLKFMGLGGVICIIIFMVSYLLYQILCASDAGIGSKPVGGMQMFPEDWFTTAAALPNIFFSITFQANKFPQQNILLAGRHNYDKLVDYDLYGLICICTFPLFKGMKYPNDSKMT